MPNSLSLCFHGLLSLEILSLPIVYYLGINKRFVEMLSQASNLPPMDSPHLLQYFGYLKDAHTILLLFIYVFSRIDTIQALQT
jgi:hypothetical protein